MLPVLTVARSPQPALAGRGGFQPPAGRRVLDWWPVRPRPRQPAQHEEVSFPFCAWSRRGLTASDPATGGHGHVACVQREVGHFQPPCYNWVNQRVNLRDGMNGTPTPCTRPERTLLHCGGWWVQEGACRADGDGPAVCGPAARRPHTLAVSASPSRDSGKRGLSSSKGCEDQYASAAAVGCGEARGSGGR